jgi:hypothetical protein
MRLVRERRPNEWDFSGSLSKKQEEALLLEKEPKPFVICFVFDALG